MNTILLAPLAGLRFRLTHRSDRQRSKLGAVGSVVVSWPGQREPNERSSRFPDYVIHFALQSRHNLRLFQSTAVQINGRLN